jgi:hypothetical protein
MLEIPFPGWSFASAFGSVRDDGGDKLSMLHLPRFHPRAIGSGNTHRIFGNITRPSIMALRKILT